MPRTARRSAAAPTNPMELVADRRTPDEAEARLLLDALAARFADHPERHPGLEWSEVERALRADPEAMTTLRLMEGTGGEPDVVALGDGRTIMFCDCAAQSPKPRRSLCYDRAALESRTSHPPLGDAVSFAQRMGARLPSADEYRRLQELGDFDTTTSSWLLTPGAIRRQDGAIFGDKRFGATFVYHNGADSYYSSRGVRTVVEVPRR